MHGSSRMTIDPGGAYSFVVCPSSWTIDNAFLSRDGAPFGLARTDTSRGTLLGAFISAAQDHVLCKSRLKL